VLSIYRTASNINTAQIKEDEMKLEDYGKPVGGGLRPATLVRTHTQTDGQTRNILSYDQL